jgi:hypothetical protein
MRNQTLKLIRNGLSYGANRKELSLKFGGRLVSVASKHAVRYFKEQPFDKNIRWCGSRGRLFKTYLED